MTGVLFRCDSTATIGLGHLSRCIALAEAFADVGVPSRFLGRFEAGGERILTRAQLRFADAGQTVSRDDVGTTAAQAQTAALTIVDSYSADADYVTELQQRAPLVALIDDFCRLSRYDCAAVINFTVEAARYRYPCDRIMCCLGPEFLLVRRALRAHRRRATVRRGPVKQILVAMGGVDGLNLAGRVVRALGMIDRSRVVRVVVGAAYAHLSDLKEQLEPFRDGSGIGTRLNDLSEEFAQADLCICAGGLTKYEGSYLGVPTAVLSQTREQADETVQFVSRGLAFDLGWSEECADERLRDGLAHVLGSDELRESLSTRSLEVFPPDPTRHAAEILTSIARRLN